MIQFGNMNTFTKGDTIKLFDYNDMNSDFTYVDEIVEAIVIDIRGASVKENGVLE